MAKGKESRLERRRRKRCASLRAGLLADRRFRNETPFLHVMSANKTAHELYRRMGFRDYGEPVVRVISLS